jgi:DNA topoisomerase I
MDGQWILRQGTKDRGFGYVRQSGRAVTDARTLARIDALRIPPAWREVRVAASPRASVQAWGFDAKGRKQYRYHESAVEQGELRKHYRVRQMARDLPAIRAAARSDLGRRRLTKRRVAAGVVQLIGEGFFRVGSERYARENKTFGITTLRKEHVRVELGAVRFSYVGKKSIEQRQVVVNRELARFVSALLRTPGARLFRYQGSDGRWADLTARDVNDYLHDVSGTAYTAKDFRTWGGTLRVATVLAEIGPPGSAREASRNVATAVRLVAAELGNTPAICRKSYVHPMVIARYLDGGETIDLPGSRRRGGLRAAPETLAEQAPEERALIRFLDRHFPERRSRRRTERRAA